MARFIVAAGGKQDDRLVQIDQPLPHFVFFLDEEPLRFAERFERLRRFAFLTECDRLVHQGFRGFVSDLQLTKELIAVTRDVVNFGAEIQLDIDVRKVEVAQRADCRPFGRICPAPWSPARKRRRNRRS
jgi:hypothetical protein